MKDRVVIHHYRSDLVGWLELCVSDKGVREISYIRPPSATATAPDNELIAGLVDELDRYFAGTLTSFSTPLDVRDGTPFQRRVWEELTRIPYGKTCSYGEIAAALGNPKASRAVGQANNKNRVPILIPCHRVIQADGSLGGYASGPEIKQALLELETEEGR